jgi:aspartyl protease family protein
MGANTMLDRILLVALTPLALAGGTATSWLQHQLDHGYGNFAFAKSFKPMPSRTATISGREGALAIHRGDDGLLHTLVRINGVPVDMVVDTGASRTILSSDDARRVFAVPGGQVTGKILTLGGERELRVQSTTIVEMAGRRYSRLDAGLVEGSPVSVIGLDWLALAGPITIAADR